MQQMKLIPKDTVYATVRPELENEFTCFEACEEECYLDKNCPNYTGRR